MPAAYSAAAATGGFLPAPLPPFSLQEVRVGAVVDLEESASVPAVADDIVHVRLLGGDGEEDPGGQRLGRLGRRNRGVPLLGTRPSQLRRERRLREGAHGASPL